MARLGDKPGHDVLNIVEENRLSRIRIIVGAALGLALACEAARAAPAPPYAVLLQQAQGSAPRLAESAANVRAAQGRAEQAGALPNPTLGLEVENLGVEDRSGLSQKQTTVTLSQPFELGGKRGARVAAGRAEVDAARARERQSAADFAYDLALAYAAAEAAQRKVQLLQEDLGRARENVRAARALVEAGKEADVRAVQARAAESGAAAELEAARAEAAENLSRLSSLTAALEPYSGIETSLLMRAGGSKPAAAAPVDVPSVLVARAERAAAARRVQAERARAVPDVTVSLGARHIDGVGGTAVVAGASAPLPLFDRNRGSVSAAAAELSAAEARLRQAELDAEAGWRAAAAQADAGQARLAAALDAEGAAREGYQLARIGYDGGKTSLLELLTARRALTEAGTRLLDARLSLIRAEASLARLAGRTPFGDDKR